MDLSLDGASVANGAVADAGVWISLHTDYPDEDDFYETSLPRQATVWTEVDPAEFVGSQVTFTGNTDTVLWFGIWTAAAGGTYLGGGEFTPTTTGTVKITPSILPLS